MIICMIDPILIDLNKITHEIREGKALLIDVREKREWDKACAEGATHFPLKKILQGRIPTLDMNVKLYLYCRTGHRSAKAALMLQSMGFTVENIGGLSDWQRAGGKVI